MSTDETETFIVSICIGLLGSLIFIIGKEISRAEEEAARAFEDARIRYQHRQETETS